jgi:hypothetical protein
MTNEEEKNEEKNKDREIHVQIVCFATEKVVKQMGPFTERTADKVERGAQINLNHEHYYTRQVLAGSTVLL